MPIRSKASRRRPWSNSSIDLVASFDPLRPVQLAGDSYDSRPPHSKRSDAHCSFRRGHEVFRCQPTNPKCTCVLRQNEEFFERFGLIRWQHEESDQEHKQVIEKVES